MPVIRVEMWAGRCLEQKRVLARRITRTVAEIAGCEPDAVQIIFQDYAPENWSVGGQLRYDKLIEDELICKCRRANAG
jgi:4-oxalocrotonate tautomerase